MNQQTRLKKKKYQVIVKQSSLDEKILGIEYLVEESTLEDLQKIGRVYGFDGITIQETKSLDSDCYLTAIELTEMSNLQRRLFGQIGSKKSAGVAG